MKKENKPYSVCDYCGVKLYSEKEAIKHEAFCKKSPLSEKVCKIPLYYFAKVGFVPFIILGVCYFLYTSYMSKIYRYESWVYACPDRYESKCYKVRADISSGDCEDIEYDIRGRTGGGCGDPYVETIYFENGGHINFDYCDYQKKDKWECYAEDSEDGTWDIDLMEVKKVRR